ncbi:MAG: KEOPS complex subunit Pcc1 [Candidatus Nitrosocaldus sp.]|nr:CTAG/PCC1 family protein [Candidatus Nitrosocaldus sp.]MDW8275324.1 KEOPS complex subunit Pcc1 [Candidatus Nitrosocaldus sp.]
MEQGMLRVRVTIRIRMDEPSKAMSMLESLEPDNVGIPAWLSMDFHIDGSVLVLTFEASLDAGSEGYGSSRRVASLISTIDEVLEHIGTMARVMNIDTG